MMMTRSQMTCLFFENLKMVVAVVVLAITRCVRTSMRKSVAFNELSISFMSGRTATDMVPVCSPESLTGTR